VQQRHSGWVSYVDENREDAVVPSEGKPEIPKDRSDFRRKDPEILEMAKTLEHFESVLLNYTKRLEDELAQEQQRDEPYVPLVSGLQIMTGLLKGFGTFIDNDVWTWMITVADRSTSHVHRRTRRFF
jgi:hypothetical protein